MENRKEKMFEYEIDLIHILKTVWRKMWLIALCAILVAAIGFSYAAFFITPTYSSAAMMYVNSKSISLGGVVGSVSVSELTAAQNLVKTYITILKTRTTLEEVAQKVAESNPTREYSWSQLMGMISAGSVNDTEIFKVTVTAEDPNDAAKIVNAITEVLPERVAEIIQGSSMKIVDGGMVNTSKVAPNVRSYTLMGFFIGLMLSCAAIIIHALFDDTIRGDDYVVQRYDYPILARVPDLDGTDSSKYKYKHYGYKGYRYANELSNEKDT